MFAPGPVKGIRLASAIFALNLLCAGASQVFLEPLDKVADRIQAVWLVRIDGVTQTTNHMQLKDGSQGPETSIQWDYGCTVQEVLAGERLPTQSTKVTVRFSMIVPVKYDENGKKEFHFSYESPISGIESDLKPGQEYLLCLPFVAKDGPQILMRAEPVNRRDAVLAALGEARLRKQRASMTQESSVEPAASSATASGVRFHSSAELEQQSDLVFDGVVLDVETLARWRRSFPIRAKISQVVKATTKGGVGNLTELPFSYKWPESSEYDDFAAPAAGDTGTFFLVATNQEWRLIGYHGKSARGATPSQNYELQLTRPTLPKGWSLVQTAPSLAVFRSPDELPDWCITEPAPPTPPEMGARPQAAPEAQAPPSRKSQSIMEWIKAANPASANLQTNMIVAVCKRKPAGQIRIERVHTVKNTIRVLYTDKPMDSEAPEHSGDLIVCPRRDMPVEFFENGAPVCKAIPVSLQPLTGGIHTEATGQKPMVLVGKTTRSFGTYHDQGPVWRVRTDFMIGSHEVSSDSLYGVCTIFSADRAQAVSVDIRSGGVATAPAGSGVVAFPYSIGTPFVAEMSFAGKGANALVFHAYSLATVPRETGSRRVLTTQYILPNRIDVVPSGIDPPFAGSKPEKSTNAVPEKWFEFLLPMLNLAPKETYGISLRFSNADGRQAIEELSLSYDPTTGLMLKPVTTKFFQSGTGALGPAHIEKFRQIEATESNLTYSCSTISLAARRGERKLWQVPISRQFIGYPPQSIELDGDHVVLQTLLPKVGMSEPTVPLAARYLKKTGAFVAVTNLKSHDPGTGQADPELKRRLERETEVGSSRH